MLVANQELITLAPSIILQYSVWFIVMTEVCAVVLHTKIMAAHFIQPYLMCLAHVPGQ